MTNNELLDFIKEGIYKAERQTSNIKSEKLSKYMFGLTSVRIKHLLNNLCSIDDCVYLELGTFRGASATCALFRNNIKHAYLVDDFCYNPYEAEPYKEEGWANVKQNVIDNLSNSDIDLNKITILQTKTNKLKTKDIKHSINVCFFDIEQKYEDSKNIIEKILPILSNISILISGNIRNKVCIEGVETAILQSKNIQIIDSITLKSTSMNNSVNWWNGIKIWLLVKKPLSREEIVKKANELSKLKNTGK